MSLTHISEDAWLGDVDESAWGQIIENRGGCNCCVSPPCFACTEPITEEELNGVGYTYETPTLVVQGADVAADRVEFDTAQLQQAARGVKDAVMPVAQALCEFSEGMRGVLRETLEAFGRAAHFAKIGKTDVFKPAGAGFVSFSRDGVTAWHQTADGRRIFERKGFRSARQARRYLKNRLGALEMEFSFVPVTPAQLVEIRAHVA